MAARIAGVVAAVILAILFGMVVYKSSGAKPIVLPTNGVTAGGKADDPAGIAALPELKSRTQMQTWPGNQTKPAEPSTGTSRALAPSLGGQQGGEQLVQQWSQDRNANGDILQDPRMLRGHATIPGDERAVLVQPQGRTWRDVHNNKLAYGGGIYIFGVSLLIALFLALRGRIPLEQGESGVSIERFSPLERANHWLTAASFIAMALTGIVVLYGKALIRPWLGAAAYSSLAQFSAWSHTTFAVPFVIGVLVMLILWVRQNLPERNDWNWLKQAGGFLNDSTEKPPARRFNAGQKIVFWAVALVGLFLAATGLQLMLPFYGLGYTGMETVQALHSAAGLMMIGVIIGHIYIGTIGMVGAFQAMWSGFVDRNWMREHHALWYRTLEARPDSIRRWDRKAEPAPTSPVMTFAAGLFVAVLAAIAATYAYQHLNVGSAQANSRDNPSLILGQDATQSPLRR